MNYFGTNKKMLYMICHIGTMQLTYQR